MNRVLFPLKLERHSGQTHCQHVINHFSEVLVNDVVQGMAHLRQNAHPHPQAMELLQYFETNYVNGVWRNIHRPGQPIVRRIPPIFPHALWNVHIATLNNDPRTNNVCESWNNAFYHIVGHNHPSMWHSIQGIQKQHAKDLSVIAQDATTSTEDKTDVGADASEVEKFMY